MLKIGKKMVKNQGGCVRAGKIGPLRGIPFNETRFKGHLKAILKILVI